MLQFEKPLVTPAGPAAQGRFVSGLTGFVPWLLLVTGFVLFFTGDSLLGFSKLSGAIWNVGHIVYFALLTLVVNRSFPLVTWRSWLVLSLAVLIAGLMIELCQSWIGRSASAGDVLNNLAGLWMGLAWVQPAGGWKTGLVRMATLVPALPALSSLFMAGALHMRAALAFPVLADFESVLELHEFKSDVRRSEAYLTHGRYGLQLNLTNGRYSGISILRPFADWSPYRTLRLDLFNPDETPLDMVIRVNDTAHDKGGSKDEDRFNYRFVVLPGWNNLVIPLEQIRQAPAGRYMDLSRISSIILYTSKLPVERTLYLDYLRLE